MGTKGKLELLRALSARARLLFRLGKYEEAERGYQQAAKYGKNQKIDNSAGSKCTNAATLQTGTLVAAKKNKRDQRHSPGIISDVNGDGTCDIIFDDGDEACDVPVSELKILQGQLKDSEDEKELQSEAYKCLYVTFYFLLQLLRPSCHITNLASHALSLSASTLHAAL